MRAYTCVLVPPEEGIVFSGAGDIGVVSFLVWVLGMDFRFFGGAGWAHHYRATSSAPALPTLTRENGSMHSPGNLTAPHVDCTGPSDHINMPPLKNLLFIHVNKIPVSSSTSIRFFAECSCFDKHIMKYL